MGKFSQEQRWANSDRNRDGQIQLGVEMGKLFSQEWRWANCLARSRDGQIQLGVEMGEYSQEQRWANWIIFPFVCSQFVNDPFRSSFSIVLKNDFFPFQNYRSFSIYFVCLLTERSFRKSFVQQNRFFKKIVRLVNNDNFFSKNCLNICLFSKSYRFLKSLLKHIVRSVIKTIVSRFIRTILNYKF